MKTDCEIIRDLLPLYVDDICSGKSREMVDEHLQECADCGELLKKLRTTEIESNLRTEKQDVVSYGMTKFKKLTTKTGITATAKTTGRRPSTAKSAGQNRHVRWCSR